ncbi:MAG: F0F1 ATP synthase subunit delta [Betaproteobacteria bacterium]|nr:F0F1 ATP synthase subunit delta [Betaproteobacteria bacterium]
MHIDWTSFILEILNFLVLVWILKRFLYQPVLGIIAARKAMVEKTLSDAQAARSDAAQLKSQYDGRLAEWAAEAARARAQLSDEMGQARARRLAELDAELAQERERHRALDERRHAAAQRALEEAAAAQGAQFASRLLARLASPSLEAALVRLALEDLAQLPPAHAQKLREALAQAAEPLVESAFPLDADTRADIARALAGLAPDSPAPRYAVEPALTCGVRILIGAYVLEADVRDELRWFVQGASE